MENTEMSEDIYQTIYPYLQNNCTYTWIILLQMMIKVSSCQSKVNNFLFIIACNSYNSPAVCFISRHNRNSIVPQPVCATPIINC